MHPNPAFRKETTDRNLDFARSRGFGVLAVNGAKGPLMAHVPFLLAEDGLSAEVHLARSNAVIAAVPGPAVLAVSGPDAYISPDWYGMTDQVPTWNYIAVHLRGQLTALPVETLRNQVENLSDLHEAGLAPKPIWKTDKMGEGVMDRMMRMILPFRLQIEAVEGTWKLNQNKPATARAGVMAALGPDHGITQAMRNLDD